MALTFDCLLCALIELRPDRRLRVRYNSSRSDEKQAATGEPLRVTVRENTAKAVFRRDDNQVMEVQEDGKLLSYNSHAPVTGYAYRYEILDAAEG